MLLKLVKTFIIRKGDYNRRATLCHEVTLQDLSSLCIDFHDVQKSSLSKLCDKVILHVLEAVDCRVGDTSRSHREQVRCHMTRAAAKACHKTPSNIEYSS